MIQISPMTRADIHEVAAIERASQVEPWSEGALAEELDKDHSVVLVARTVPNPCGGLQRVSQGDDMRGHVCVWVVAGEAQILNLAVHPDHRRGGIGRTLLLSALASAYGRGARKATLEVRKGNRAAQKLYEGVGFETTGERPGFYGGLIKEDAVLMDLKLDDRWILEHCSWSQADSADRAGGLPADYRFI